MKLAELLSISGPTPIRQLSKEQLKEMQRALSLLGYPVGDIDGLIGPKTRSAWSEFKTDVYSGNPEFIGKQSVVALQEKLDGVIERKDHDFSSKGGTIEAIKCACRAMGIGLNSQISYVLATTQWETNQTFFTGRKITDYLDETKTDFIGARRCINGNDKAHEIADLAKKFLVHL